MKTSDTILFICFTILLICMITSYIYVSISTAQSIVSSSISDRQRKLEKVTLWFFIGAAVAYILVTFKLVISIEIEGLKEELKELILKS